MKRFKIIEETAGQKSGSFCIETTIDNQIFNRVQIINFKKNNIMKKEIKDVLDVVNQHFVEKFANGEFIVLYQSETNCKIECDGEIFWLWHNYGVDGLVSNFDNPIHLNMPEDVKKRVYETITKSNEEEKIQRDIKIMEDRIEELKGKLKKNSK